MGRFKFILFLILIAVSLHFFSKTLRTALPLVSEPARQYASMRADPFNASAPTLPALPKTPSLSDEFSKQFKELTGKIAFKRSAKEKSANSSENPHAYDPGENANDASFLQITLEDLRPSVNNKALGPEASARLDKFLHARRARNAELANETEDLFGSRAKREVLRILIEDERASVNNAKTSKTPEEFGARQRKTDARTQRLLSEVFERYKQDFNRRAKTNSPAWNDFFKRVNEFKKAND